MLTHDLLKELLEYDSNTGWFTWRITRGSRAPAGGRAGSVSQRGYRWIYLAIDGARVGIREHRLAWFYTYGEWPGLIDHINGDPSDNRIANLRIATNTQNNANAALQKRNTSGFKGVRRCKGCFNRWDAQICVGGRRIYLGAYGSPEEAHAAYVEAAKEHFGEFARFA